MPAGRSAPLSGRCRYLTKIEALKREMSVPVIASLNATSAGGWIEHARRIEQAGADALELSLYHVAADPSLDAAGREAADLDIVRSVRAAVSIPLSVKLSPYYSAMANFTASVVGAGPTASAFNRFQPISTRLVTSRAPGESASRASCACMHW